MSSTSSPSAKQSTQSSDSEKTPDSGTSRTKRIQSCNSPTLRTFDIFHHILGQFATHIRMKISCIGDDPVDLLQTELERLDRKHKGMQKHFQKLIRRLDRAIEAHEAKKPTDLPTEANSVISPKERAAYRYSLFKDINTIDKIFANLDKYFTELELAIHRKISKSMYYDHYSISMEKKLKNLKMMCKDEIEFLDDLGEEIATGIAQNEEIRRNNIF